MTRWKPVVQSLKWLLFLSVLVFVLLKARQLWADNEHAVRSCEMRWLLASGVAYAAGWLPAGAMWRLLLGSDGRRVGWWNVLRAYYCSHPGKYVPGKALAIGIRAALLRRNGVAVSRSVVTGLLETLLTMGGGLALGAGLLPFLLDQESFRELPVWLRNLIASRWLGPIVGVAMLALGMAISPSVLRLLSHRAAKRAEAVSVQDAVHVQAEEKSSHSSVGDQPAQRISRLAGLLAVPCWMLHGLSLLCVLKALGTQDITILNWLRATGAVAGATSIGFFALFAPGGIGVREGILFAVLKPVTGGPAAVAAAGLLRLVWLLTEMVCAGLFVLIPTRQNHAAAGDLETNKRTDAAD